MRPASIGDKVATVRGGLQPRVAPQPFGHVEIWLLIVGSVDDEKATVEPAAIRDFHAWDEPFEDGLASRGGISALCDGRRLMPFDRGPVHSESRG